MRLRSLVAATFVASCIAFASGAALAADFAALLAEAKAGDVSAMHNVGAAYANGQVVQQDYSEAKGWFEKAALAGQHNSMYSLGVMYRLGQGVEVDLVKSYAWFALAAEYIPKDQDEWFIPRAKVAMYLARPQEIAAQLSKAELLRAKQLQAQLRQSVVSLPGAK